MAENTCRWCSEPATKEATISPAVINADKIVTRRAITA